jgi:predicted AlkP superfamily phosphohydrolase/phosphomutase
MSQEKILVIGLDAATFDIIDPLVKKGRLPNIQRFMEQGVRTDLRTTIPPISPNAWTSFATGKNAGKHAIYSFSEQKTESYEIQFVNALSRKAKPVWSVLSEAGRTVGVINMPVTYPPDEVNGFVISGMDTPGRESDFVFPKDLKTVLLKEFDYVVDYSFLGTVNKNTGQKILDNLYDVERKRVAAAKYLMKAYDWDFFFVVLVALDRVQHFFWHCMEPLHPRYNEDGAELFRDSILDMYQRMDDLVGELLDGLDEDVSVFIMSDHGAGPFDNSVPDLNLNEWLTNNGYLKLKGKETAGLGLLKKSREFLRKKLSSGMKQRLKVIFPRFREKLQSHVYFSPIVWSQSRAFATYDEFMARGIRINLKGREPEGTVLPGKDYEDLREELIQKIGLLQHPRTDESIVEKIYKREELFEGDYSHKAPDLIVDWNDKAFFSKKAQDKREAEIRDQKFKLTPILRSGDHRSHGVFISKGVDIKKAERLPEAHIMDLAPTILYLMGEPVPESMDGKVLTRIFTDDFIQKRPVKYTRKVDGNRKEDRSTYSESEAKKIEDRLKKLGYLD